MPRNSEEGLRAKLHGLGVRSRLAARVHVVRALSYMQGHLLPLPAQWQQLFGTWMEQVFQDECLCWHCHRVMKQDHF